MHLREIRNRPHKIAARKGEQDARPDEPAPVLVVSFRFPRSLASVTRHLRLVRALGCREPSYKPEGDGDSEDKECGERRRHGG